MKIRFVACAKTTGIALRKQIIDEFVTKHYYTVNVFWNRRRHLTLLFFGLLAHVLPGYTQNFCPTSPSTETGGFTVPAQVCVGKPFTITGVPASLANITYVYQYNGNGLPAGSSSTSNVYTAPGSYTILQVAAGSNATNAVACRVVEAVPVKAVSFTTTVCSDRSIALTYKLDAETIKYNSLNINWGDGSANQIVVLTGNNPTGVIPHLYATAGSFPIQVYGSYIFIDGCIGAVSFQRVTVENTATVEPSILSLTSDATKATINYQGPSGSSLELYQKNVSGFYVPTGLTGTANGVFTVPASGTSVNCFQVVAKDGCGNTQRRSSEVCSLVLTGQATDRKNVLNWQPYAGVGGTFDSYRIYRNNSTTPLFSAKDRLLTTNTDMNDITCNQTYCYSLEATINNAASPPTVVRSMSTCVSGIDNGAVPSPLSTYVSVQSDGVNVQATLPTVGTPSPYTLVVSRADGSGNGFNPLGTSDDRSFLDKTAETATQSYCYQAAVRNACGVLSKPSPPACTILLTKKPDGSITWTSASPFSNESPQTYQVIFIDPVTGASDKKPLGSVTSYRPDADSQVTQYQIAAVNNAGVESYSNPVQVELGTRVFVPTAFTPNGDQQNASFMAKGPTAFWDTFELTIYSRWGDVVYHTTDKATDGWNGDVNGTPALPGTYGYRIRIRDTAGKTFERTGQLLLIR